MYINMDVVFTIVAVDSALNCAYIALVAVAMSKGIEFIFYKFTNWDFIAVQNFDRASNISFQYDH